MLYFTQFMAPDSFTAFRIRGKKIGLFSALEIGRAHREAQLDEILSLVDWKQQAQQIFNCKAPTLAQVITTIARSYKISRFTVPDNFPYGLALALQKLGLSMKTRPAPFFPERLIKSDSEIAAIKAINKVSAAGIRMAQHILEKASIKGNKLYYNNRVLTSEFIRTEIDKVCLEHGAIAKGTIVAGGNQACDPHCVGSGSLYANELIIVDVFPRSSKTQYYGDMTRTFLRGHASPEQKALIHHVQKAQKLAMTSITAGAKASKIHDSVCHYFNKAGMLTSNRTHPPTGFFHRIGHGLGLEVHEPLDLGCHKLKLKEGMVLTVEPGLYYPNIGGVRIEDVVCVHNQKCTLLSQCNYRWHLR